MSPAAALQPIDFPARLHGLVEAVRVRTSVVPRLALVLGSGLGGVAEAVEDSVVIPFTELPGLPAATAPGHTGQLVLGQFAGQPVVIQRGRLHLYEGVEPGLIGLQIALLHALGARALLLTNAAGGVNPEYRPGSLMVIADHLNMTGRTPLAGANEPSLGPRCPDMTNAWSPRLRADLHRAGAASGVSLEEGIYAGWPGPAFETPAEVRMLRILGADAVGMSTVLEAITARWLGLELCGVSLITNVGAGYATTPLTHEAHMEAAAAAGPRLAAVIRSFVGRLES